MKSRDQFSKVVDGLPPIHPGELLADELAEFDMSSEELDAILGVPEGTVSDLVTEKRGIDAELALRLARYFGAGERLWMNLQVSYDLKIAEREIGAAITKQVQPRTDGSPIFEGGNQ